MFPFAETYVQSAAPRRRRATKRTFGLAATGVITSLAAALHTPLSSYPDSPAGARFLWLLWQACKLLYNQVNLIRFTPSER